MTSMNWFFSEKTCDGIVHCFFGEDESDEICKDVLSFQEEATIECLENRPGYNITIRAIPCDGIPECRNGMDEACEEKRGILYGAIFTLVAVTYGIYHYLKWKHLKLNQHDILQSTFDDEWSSINCIDLVGDDLARLKVSKIPLSIIHVFLTFEFSTSAFKYQRLKISNRKSHD